MLKRVQHDNKIESTICHPELGSGSRFYHLSLVSHPTSKVVYFLEK